MRTGNLQRKPNHCSHRKEWATAMRRRTTGAAEAPIRGRGKLFALTDPIDLNAPIGVMDLKIADGHRGGAAADGGGTVRQHEAKRGQSGSSAPFPAQFPPACPQFCRGRGWRPQGGADGKNTVSRPDETGALLTRRERRAVLVALRSWAAATQRTQTHLTASAASVEMSASIASACRTTRASQSVHRPGQRWTWRAWKLLLQSNTSDFGRESRAQIFSSDVHNILKRVGKPMLLIAVSGMKASSIVRLIISNISISRRASLQKSNPTPSSAAGAGAGAGAGGTASGITAAATGAPPAAAAAGAPPPPATAPAPAPPTDTAICFTKLNQSCRSCSLPLLRNMLCISQSRPNSVQTRPKSDQNRPQSAQSRPN